jgi:Tfp pilus assembly protein PilX
MPSILRIGRLSMARQRADDGIALMGVVLSMAVLTLFVTTSLALTIGQQAPTRRDQDAKTALAAAQAGVDEYLSRLTADSNYWQSTDATNTAFSSGQTVQGTGTSGARYTYSLVSTAGETAADGIVRLKVTGYSTPGGSGREVSRTLYATMKPKGFLNYVYLSDVEVVDPDLLGSSSACANYYYTGRSSTSGCSEIQWIGGDVVNGPLHSNDALQINGPVTFRNVKTETSWPATQGLSSTAKTWWGSQNPTLPSYQPKYAAAISLPNSNNALLQYTTPGADGAQTGPGCYYTGNTRIIFQGTTMRVLSPSTSSAGTPSRCLNVSNRATEQTVSIPPVIYVDSTTASCTLGALGYPMSGESYSGGSSSATSWGRSPNYSCTRGSVYLQGSASTQVTVAAKDDVVITGNLTTGSGTSGTDVIGLIAGNYAWVYHPVNGSNNNLLSGGSTVTSIQAAILALRHSFLVQNWQLGATTGTLNVTGSISQKFRGAVGTSSGGAPNSGYLKNYVYDPRLVNLQPPYFLKPDNTPYEITGISTK